MNSLELFFFFFIPKPLNLALLIAIFKKFDQFLQLNKINTSAEPLNTFVHF